MLLNAQGTSAARKPIVALIFFRCYKIIYSCHRIASIQKSELFPKLFQLFDRIVRGFVSL